MMQVEKGGMVEPGMPGVPGDTAAALEHLELDVQLDAESEDSGTSGEEVPVWVRGEQRWVSGVDSSTTCADLIVALLQDETTKGKLIGEPHQYHITERWRGVEQPLDNTAAILDIWNAWGTAQSEVRISLRKISSSEQMSSRRRRHHRPESSCSWGSKHSAHTLHPRRLYALAADHRQLPPGGTEELLKLVLAQGEIIRKQLRRLRYSENQIGFLEDKTHRARVRKHGSNYLLETYLKGLPDANETGASPSGDKNSDSGVMTEGDSGEPTTSTQNPYDRLSPAYSDGKDEENSASEELLKSQGDALDTINKLNKKLLKEEELLVRLHISIKKYERNKDDFEQIQKSLTELRTEMAKSSCEMQHNEVVLEETSELLDARKMYLNNLQAELGNVDQENEMLQTLLYSRDVNSNKQPSYKRHSNFTKELNTLV